MDDEKFIYKFTSKGIQAYPVIRETEKYWVIPCWFYRRRCRYVNKNAKSWFSSIEYMDLDKILDNCQEQIGLLEKNKKNIDDQLLSMRMCKDFILEGHSSQELADFFVRMGYIKFLTKE